MDEWLRLLRLEEYGSALEAQGYSTIDDVTQLTWEDLEDIGIVKLGHQKRLLLAIKRVKDIKAGKSFIPHSPFLIQTQVSTNKLLFYYLYKMYTSKVLGDIVQFHLFFKF